LGKKLGTITGKHLSKKSGKELTDRVKTQVRRLGKTKMCKTRRFFALGKRPFCTRKNQAYTRPIKQGDKVESESNKRVNPS
jgi:hypothetical protein